MFVLIAALVATVAASTAVAIAPTAIGTIWVFLAMAGLVVAFDIALATGGIVVLSAVTDQSYVGAYVVGAAVAFVLAVVAAGLISVGVVAAFRQIGHRVNPTLVTVIVLLLNTFLIAVVAALSASHPGGQFSVVLNRSIYSGVHDYLWQGIVMSFMWAIVVLLLATGVFLAIHWCRRLLDRISSQRMISVFAVAVAIIAAIVSVFFAGLNIAATSAGYVEWYGHGMDISNAVTVGGVSIVMCAVTGGIASVIAWCWNALRQR